MQSNPAEEYFLIYAEIECDIKSEFFLHNAIGLKIREEAANERQSGLNRMIEKGCEEERKVRVCKKK